MLLWRSIVILQWLCYIYCMYCKYTRALTCERGRTWNTKRELLAPGHYLDPTALAAAGIFPVHTQTHGDTHRHTRMYTYIHTHMYWCSRNIPCTTQTNTDTHIHTGTRTDTHINTHSVCVYVRMHVLLCACACMYVCEHSRGTYVCMWMWQASRKPLSQNPKP